MSSLLEFEFAVQLSQHFIDKRQIKYLIGLFENINGTCNINIDVLIQFNSHLMHSINNHIIVGFVKN